MFGLHYQILSILHHSLPSIDGKIAEEQNMGWHFRSARALKKIAKFNVECARPSGNKQRILKIIDGIPVILSPTIKFSPSRALWKWDEISPELVKYVITKVKLQGYVPYIHEYRTLNSELIIRKLLEYSMILQHHGTSRSTHSLASSINPLNMIKEASKAKREKLLKKVRGAIFVLNKNEKEYLEKLGVEASVKIRTMAVDFNEIKLVSEEKKKELREKLGIPEDAVVLCSYVGVFKEEFSMIKGTHLIAKIWSELSSKVKSRLEMIVTGLGTHWVKELRGLGIRTYPFLHPHQYLSMVIASDIYFVPATSSYYYGGPGVAIMEALALGKPVVSPTLIHFPEKDKVKHIGAITPFVDNENALRTFVECLVYVIENISSFKAEQIRQIAYKYYSWESFVKDFEEAVRGI